MSSLIQIVGFTGSLREQSSNKAALHAAQALLPPAAHLEMVSLADLPLSNQDVEGHEPEAVCGKPRQSLGDNGVQYLLQKDTLDLALFERGKLRFFATNAAYRSYQGLGEVWCVALRPSAKEETLLPQSK